MSADQEKKERKARKRSPGYPMISLEEAIQRAKILWDKDKNNLIPLGAAYEHLGYKFIGGYGGRVIAALKKFGLISEKQGGIILTEEAVDLALHDPLDNKYIDTVKKLALKPDIYEILFSEYNGNLPSDATLKIKLFKEHGFNSDKINGFLLNFRKTIEFANLHGSEIADPIKLPTEEKKGMPLSPTLPIKTPTTSLMPSLLMTEAEDRVIATYSIGRGQTARILISGELTTEKSIDKLLTRMREDKEDLVENIADEKPEATDN